MRRYLVILWTFLLFASAANAVWADQHNQHLKLIDTQEIKNGEILFLKLPGNPDIGYKYKLNRELSSGLHLVDIDFLGWLMTSKSQTIFFRKRDVMNVAVRTKAPGQAELAFDYYRRISGRTRTTTTLVRINIKMSKANR
ncbi:MAG: protease inhibitor I42 family protein [Alphaproteobacteria bacterium]